MENRTQKEIEQMMNGALDEAKIAGFIGEVPIGAIVVHNGEIIGRGHNLREHAQDATMHAEIIAIQEACMNLHSWRLEDCQLYVTIEPCPMCAGAILNSRIEEVYFGATDPKAGAVSTLYQLLQDDRLNHRVFVQSGILESQAKNLMQNFFRGIRAKQKAAKNVKQQNNSKNG